MQASGLNSEPYEQGTDNHVRMFMYIVECLCRNLGILGPSDEICVLDMPANLEVGQVRRLVKYERHVNEFIRFNPREHYETTLHE